MSQPKSPTPLEENNLLRQVVAEARSLLDAAEHQLRSVARDECLMAESPVEVQSAMEIAVESIGGVLRRLKAATAYSAAPFARRKGGPTRQQGQFLAFIREYMIRNEAGVAPSHAELQRFFELTPPSVNSMLMRLEKRGFIRRIPGRARAIEITISTDSIPPLDRPFKI